tara:strand:+ start:163 stop:705 length:543 start_codon:yes stop_codon:yes gene_type:complete
MAIEEASEAKEQSKIIEKKIRPRLVGDYGEIILMPDFNNVTKLYLGSCIDESGHNVGSKITDVGLKEVAKLENLAHLDLNATVITDAGLKEVAKLQQLKELDLYLCFEITDAGLKEVAKCGRLNVLRLRATPITDAGLKELAKLKQLAELDLCQTHVTEAGVARLQKALPKCKILYSPTK